MRKIKVNGNVSQKIMPNRVKVQINIKEYSISDSKLIILSEIIKKLNKNFSELNISKKQIKIVNSYSQREYSLKSKDLAKYIEIKHQVIQVSFKKSNFNNLQKLTQQLIDVKGVSDISIVEAKHTKINQLRKELKIKSVLVAKQKAKDILKPLDKTIGEVINVVDDSSYDETVSFGRSRSFNLEKTNSISVDETPIDFKINKIKIHSSVTIEFEIV